AGVTWLILHTCAHGPAQVVPTVAALALGQVVVHLAACHHAVVGGHDHGAMGVTESSVAALQHAASMPGGLGAPMLALHVAATVGLAMLLVHGDGVLWRLWDLGRRLAPALPVPVPVRPTAPGPQALAVVPRPVPAPGTGSVDRRGPPVPVVAPA
ncbi:hypothetical protein N869_09505, partial [Cellulomonas bogoriensis 69B4 = DSM 16987]